MVKSRHIFRNYDALNDCREDKLTPAENTEFKRILKELLKIAESGKSAIVAYSSPSGSGKSTIARRLLRNEKMQKAVEIRTCEIWQYDNPDKVWEDFVLTTISKDKKALDDLSRKAKYGQTKRRIIAMTVIAAIIATVLRVMSEVWLRDGLERTIVLATLDILSISAPIILSLINSSELVDGLDIDYRFQIEQILLEELKKSEKPLFVLIEDIERSETGIKLLESLHSFLSRNGDNFSKNLIIFTPTTKDFIYKSEGKESRAQLERNLKIYDYIFEGWLRGRVNKLDTKTLFNSLDCRDDKVPELLDLLIDNAYGDSSLINMRAVQHMLREVDNFCYSHPGADPCITLLYASTKYIRYAAGPYESDYVNRGLRGNVITPNMSHAEKHIGIIKKGFRIEDTSKYGVGITFADISKISCAKDDENRLFMISVPRMYKYILA